MRYTAAVLIVFTCLQAGLSSPTDRDDSPLFGGTIIRPAEPSNTPVDPATASVLIEREAAYLLFPCLLAYSPGSALTADAAESWERSGDGLVFTIRLRGDLPDARGVPLTAEDARASLHRLFRLNPSCPAARLLKGSIEGAEDFIEGRAAEVAGIETVDEQMLLLHLSRPQAMLEACLADVNTALVSASGALGGWGAFLPAGRGAFEPNVHYHRGRPFADRVVFGRNYSPPAGAQRRPAVARAGADGLFENRREIVYPGLRCVYMALDARSATLADARVRRRIIAAVDADKITGIFLGGNAAPSKNLLPERFFPPEIWRTGNPAEHQPSQVSVSSSLTIGYPGGSLELATVARRVRVDLFVAGIASEIVELGENDSRCDIWLVEALVADACPAYCVWRMLVGLAGISDDDSWLVPPAQNEAQWLVETDSRLAGAALMKPLYHTAHRLFADGRLRGVRFRPDGTLALDGAWIDEDPALPGSGQ